MGVWVGNTNSKIPKECRTSPDGKHSYVRDDRCTWCGRLEFEVENAKRLEDPYGLGILKASSEKLRPHQGQPVLKPAPPAPPEWVREEISSDTSTMRTMIKAIYTWQKKQP